MNNLKRYTIKGIIFVIITGALAHFVYEWTGDNFIIGFLFPINESVWEHMKLCFFPMLLYFFYMDYKLADDYPCITSSAMFGVLLSTFLVPVLFYTYSGILGYTITFFDIGTFIVSVLLSFLAVYKLTLTCKLETYEPLLRILILIVAICFFIFTYWPLDIGIFEEPESIRTLTGDV